jgi:hypothetical protein
LVRGAGESSDSLHLPQTLATGDADYKHLFDRHADRVWFLSDPGVTHSYSRSNEHLFDGAGRAVWLVLGGELMSVAPDIAPDVLIPAQARRTARDTRAARLVSGNLITPTAFHLIDLEPNQDDERRLRLLAPGRGAADELDRRRHGAAARSAASAARPAAVVDQRSVAVAVRLTARGRLAVALAAVVVALGIAIGAWFGAAGAGESPAATPLPAQIVVHDGDTLWSIATVVAPSRDPRATVDELRRINGLGSADLAAGQVLRLR